MSRTLLARYGIETPLSPYHEHNAAEARPRALQAHRRRAGAGAHLRRRHAAHFRSRLSSWSPRRSPRACGHDRAGRRPRRSPRSASPACRPTASFSKVFCRPDSAARRERINALAAVPGTLVFYEAPSRLAETLADLAHELGPRPAAVARELTKLHEEVRRGALDALAAEYRRAARRRGARSSIVVGPPQRARSGRRRRARRGDRRRARQALGQGRGRGGRRQARPAATRGLCARARARGRAAGEGARRPSATERRRGAHLFGLKAESIAALLLRLKGYSILARRYSSSPAARSTSSRGGAARSPSSRSRRAPTSSRRRSRSAQPNGGGSARAARVWLTRNPWAAGLTLARRRGVRRARPASPPRAGRV